MPPPPPEPASGTDRNPGTDPGRSPPAPGATLKRPAMSGPMRGALWMVGAAFAFSSMVGLLRIATEWMHPLQAVFFRNAFAIAFMTPWMLSVGLAGLRTKRLPLHLLRSLLGVGAMMCWFLGLSMLPLGEAVTLSFTTPLFATVGAALVLGEVVRIRRWTATAIGFLGVLIIMRPGVEEMSTAALLVLASAMFMSCSVLVLKTLSGTEDSNAIVTYMTLFMTPMSLIPALIFWETPGLAAIGVMIAVAGLGTIGHQCLTRAMKAADASVVMPFEYLKLPIVAAIGYLFFGETTDWATWIGAAVIVASAVYIARRESRMGVAAAPLAARRSETAIK
ncbi:DMT family transporter [Fodinicurvata sp. EGI_FJ10296]|uniref:DMT family transporter n=1 Tax=Fodinicurvata sp. EGI_FJ10296 TaxID=3231908 RepID=UPI00345340B3